MTNGCRAGRLTASSSSWPWVECLSEPAMGPFARLIQSRRRTHSVRPPGHFHAYRNIVFDGHGQQRWRVDFEISEGGWNYSCEMGRAALRHQFEGNLLVLGSLAGKLNFQIGVNGCGCGVRFGQAGSYGDHGKLRPPRDLDHMNVAVAVPGIKRLDRHRDQKIALSGVANSLASCRVAHTLALMQRMGYMVGESELFENPLAIRCGQHRKGQKHEGHQDGLFHKRGSEFNGYRQKSCYKRPGGYDGHRPMRRSDAVDLLPFALLIEGDRSQNRRQNHPWAMDPGHSLVETDRPTRFCSGYSGRADGIVRAH